jgi:hypothetical protein
MSENTIDILGYAENMMEELSLIKVLKFSCQDPALSYQDLIKFILRAA